MTRHMVRAVAGLAAVGATVAVAAVAAAATAPPPPATQQRAQTQVTYRCSDSSGSLAVPVTVAAAFPDRLTPGKPVQPTAAQLTLHLPPTLVASLTAEHAATVGGTASLTVALAQGTSQATVPWAGLTWPSATLPASGGLTLTATGPVPAVRPAGGPVTFSAGSLSLRLTLRSQDGATATASGRPVALACRPAAGQRLLLASVGAAPGPRHKKAARTAAKHSAFCPKEPKGGFKLNPRFKAPRPPKGIGFQKETPAAACAIAVGFTDVRKLNGASRLGPVTIAASIELRSAFNFSKSTYVQIDSAGVLDFRSCSHGKCTIKHGLPPTQATFLAFGFVPATATMHLDEIGNLDLFSVGTETALTDNFSFAALRLTISNVKVNGVPLNVGQHCQAVRPLIVKLTGQANGPIPYGLQTGGPLQGSINIPAFKDCGVGENLDPLFGAMRHGLLVGSISGPGNFSILTQGPLCTPSGDTGCPLRSPKPIH